jgi:hypothetical protein
MVCFNILLAYPIRTKNVMNLLQTRRLHLLQRKYNADIFEVGQDNNTAFVRITACDEEAVGILRDIPSPIYCVEIRMLWSKELLYGFKKITGVNAVPPRDSLLLKQVYWGASQLERHLFAF